MREREKRETGSEMGRTTDVTRRLLALRSIEEVLRSWTARTTDVIGRLFDLRVIDAGEGERREGSREREG